MLNCCHVCYDHEIEVKEKVSKHKGTNPCNWSPEWFTQRDWSQGLVPQTVLKKRLI